MASVLTQEEREAVERLQREVIEPSMTDLVLLDFWAEWCGPCKQLSPVIEKIAADYSKKGVRLVKVDVDSDKVIAAQFQIQSIPTVYAFYKGQPVADLTNYRTEGQLKRAIDQLLAQLGVGGEAADQQAEIEPLLAHAEDSLAKGDSTAATGLFRQAREIAPDSAEAAGGLVRALITGGSVDEARSTLDSLSDELKDAAPVARARAALETASAGAGADSAGLEKKIAADPNDLDSRFELAGSKMAAGKRDEAADQLLAIVERDKDWNGGAARKRFLQLLEAQGLEDEWARTQRRRLSALLFT